MHCPTSALRRVFAAVAVLATAGAAAQQPPPANPAPAAPAFRSAFDGYQRFADQDVAPWKESNDTVGRIGGWRAYAREAQAPAPPSGSDRPARPAAPPAPAASGHRH